jgi:hypothetical protein
MLKSYSETFQQLCSTPRNVIDSFLHSHEAENSESRYMHPFKFILIGVITVLFLNTLLVDFTFEPNVSDLSPEQDNEQMIEIAEWIQVSNVRAATQFLPMGLMLLFIPMLALGGLIFLRNEMNGFYANLILNSYAVGASMVALLPMIPVWMFLGFELTDPFVNSTLPTVLIAGVMIWIYKLYLSPSGLMEWIRLISAYASGYVFYVILSGFAAGVIGYMMFVVNRILELSGA